MVLSTFLKQAISKNFRSDGLDMALFDNETFFFLFFPEGFDQTRVFLRHLVRPEARPVTSKMSRTARSRQPPSWHPKWPPNPQILFGTKLSNPPQQPVFSRNIAQSGESLYPRVSTPKFQSKPQQKSTRQQPKPQKLNTLAPPPF